MIVRELIEHLLQFDMEAGVWIKDDGNEWVSWVHGVEVGDRRDRGAIDDGDAIILV